MVTVHGGPAHWRSFWRVDGRSVDHAWSLHVHLAGGRSEGQSLRQNEAVGGGDAGDAGALEEGRPDGEGH